MLKYILLAGFLAASTMAAAQDRDVTDLTRLDTDSPEAFEFFDTLGLYDILAILAEESSLGVDAVREEFFPTIAPEVWAAETAPLFAPEVLVSGFEAAWNDDAVGPEARATLLEFYQSDLGRRIVASEIAARAGMADADIEEAGRAALAMAIADDDPRLPELADFIVASGLVELNISGVLNAQLGFLFGLSEGGGLTPPMTDEDIVNFVAAQEPAIRAEAETWLMTFHLMAYGSLTEAEFDQFRAVIEGPEGQAMTAAVFVAFDAMFNELQYQLGLAAARFAQGDDI